jgi:hypothetical protein
MKTLTKFNPFLVIIIAIAFASCNGKPGSTSVKDSTATATSTTTITTTPRTPASTVNFVLDSLGIKDDGERKICKVYDEAMTAYVDALRASLADTTNLSIQTKTAIDKEFDAKFKAIQPDIDNLKKQSSPMEAMKMVQFIVAYEGQRQGPLLAHYAEVMSKRANAILLKKTDSILKKNKNQ